MSSVTSPVNNNNRDVDALLQTSGTTGIMKRAVNPRAVTGGDSQVADQGVGTHVDDAALAAGSDSVVVIAGFADETSPDSVNEGDVGAVRMGLDRILLVRPVGLATIRANHAIDVSTTPTSLGTAITSDRRHIEVYNGGTVTVFLGPSGVGTATGFPLGTAAYYYEDSGLDLYGVTAAGTASLRVMEMR